MPVYIDSHGNRYWFDGEPDPDATRGDLVLAPPEAQDGPDADEIIPE